MAKVVEYLNALPPKSRLEEYEFLDVLGSGGFGVTYRGFDHLLGKTVAIKEYLPNDLAVRADREKILPKSTADQEDFDWGLERFLEEARALARFDHANIIRVHRFFQANGTAYIVMDYAEGETLSQLLERERVLSPERLNAVLYPMLDGLEAMHALDFLHRDIKPGNVIILKKDGSPVIIDFGAARQAINAKSRSVTAIITPGYAPIEQYSTRGDQGPATDIYSLAAVAYRAIVGDRPDDATNRLTHDKLDGWTDRVRGWEPAFLEAINQGLAFNKAERPQSVGEWRKMLASGASAARQAGVARESARWRPIWAKAKHVARREHVRWAALGGTTIALALGVFWFSADNVSPAEPTPPVATEAVDELAVQRVEQALSENAVERAEALLAELDSRHPRRSAMVAAVAEARARQQTAAVARLVAEASAKVAAGEPVPADLRDAVAGFRKALALEPVNADARAGLRRVEDRYVALIEEALAAGLPRPADEWLDELERADSAHPELDSLRERAIALERQVAVASEIEASLSAASAQLASNQLMLPEGDNAVANYRRALALDPENIEAKTGLAAVEVRYVELIRLAVFDQAPERGRRLLANLTELNRAHPELPRLGVEVRAVEGRSAPPPAVPARRPPSGVAQPLRDEEDVLWNSVKDSCRKGDLERYCNAYPNGRHIEACWRKLSECLRHRASESG